MTLADVIGMWRSLSQPPPESYGFPVNPQYMQRLHDIGVCHDLRDEACIQLRLLRGLARRTTSPVILRKIWKEIIGLKRSIATVMDLSR